VFGKTLPPAAGRRSEKLGMSAPGQDVLSQSAFTSKLNPDIIKRYEGSLSARPCPTRYTAKMN
jgi:hypothetical protein